ncbi:hypothetical protein [Rhizobium laguerreae]|uniref:hypothetical protein n=1 Tax=Rhizobium laguerreae TaxID=1076926 RepID=UPI001C90D736|nr:hypothetical protein [Rhizobium laguerreae]MBY3136738.1 hypothetical protein [Rhizobium laguerreae]
MSVAKLHINISQGIIDAEGDVEFVTKVYEDFRDRLGHTMDGDRFSAVEANDDEYEAPTPVQPAVGVTKKGKSKRAQASRASKSSTGGTGAYKPHLVDDLDTTEIKDFIARYSMTNHSNNIVAFLKFLESKGRKPATLDEVFTCYRDAGIKLPIAYVQAFRDAASKKRFIEFTDSTSVELTLRGGNHIDHGSMDKKGDAA